MTTIELSSTSKPGTTYTLVINNGKAIGCLHCDEKRKGEAKYGPMATCHHMRDWNRRKAEAEQAEKWREEAEKRAAFVVEFGIYA